MRDSLKDHIRILQFAAYKARLENLKPLQKIPGELEKVLSSQEANADLPTEIPAHALVRVSETRSIISPKWLAKQRPPQALIDGGGEIYDEKDVYSPEKRNPDKMQCWQKDGNWYWNAKARTWLATQWYARQ